MFPLPASAVMLPAAALPASGSGHPLLGAGHPIALPFGRSIDSILLLELLLLAGLLALWLVLLAAARAWTRPADVAAGPASSDLPGDEPPAVISLLAGRWRLNEDAAEATLIDLAARHWIELRQPGNDPAQTTVHLLPAPASDPPLTLYEQQVLEHVRHQAVDRVVPLTALTFRDAAEAQRWTSRLHAAVIDDARARGLTRRRFSPALVSLLSAAAVLPAGLLALVIIERGGDAGAAPGAGLIGWGVLSALAGRPLGERDTPAGRELAARWFGLRAFLRGDEAFARLPPAAVTVWDRYLSYGDALGVTRVCSALIDLGMGDRKRVWSSFGGSWHRVRVRYPKVWARYGLAAPQLLLFAALGVLIGAGILKLFAGPLTGLPGLFSAVPVALGVLLIGRGLYRIARTLADLIAPRRLTGEVLWVELWRSTQAKENRPAEPIVHYFAVDDGSSERTTAWALPSAWCDRAHPGDVVSLVVRPWTRRVTELTVDARRSARLVPSAGAPAPQPAAAIAGSGPASPPGPDEVFDAGVHVPIGGVLPDRVALALAGAAPTVANRELLSLDEVAGALGRPVVADGAAARMSLGPFELLTFRDPSAGTPVLVIAVALGAGVELVLRGARKGRELPGIGEEAWAGEGWVVGRRAQSVIRITVEPGTSTDPLPALLTLALTRIPPA